MLLVGIWFTKLKPKSTQILTYVKKTQNKLKILGVVDLGKIYR